MLFAEVWCDSSRGGFWSSGGPRPGVSELPPFNLYFTHSLQCLLFFFFLEVAGVFMKGEELLELSMTSNGPMKFVVRAFCLNI